MTHKRIWIVLNMVVILSMLLVGCGGAAQPPVEAPKTEAPAAAPAATEAPPAEPAATEAPAAEPVATEAPAAEQPKKLNIAIGAVVKEEAWTTGLLQDLEKVIAEKPHGLEITYHFLEEVTFDSVGVVLDQAASTGEFDIIWAHSTFYEAVAPLMDEYPEIAWVVAGSGNKALGKNMWYMEITGYESAFLIGALGGLLTKSNVLGTVAEYPTDQINSLTNAYIAGAKSVNPEIDVQFAFIESWYDPPKAIESIKAQIANGADFIYSQPIGPIEACKDAKVWCAGSYVDQYDLGPEVVLTSNLILWEPHWNVIIDAWWDHAANGAPYNAPMEPVLFTLAQGGSDIASFHDNQEKIPADVYQKIMDLRQQIIDGTLVVEFNPKTPE